jgi:hypothetical protein
MTKTAKKSSTDLLYIPTGFLYRSNLRPTKRDIMCFAPFAGKEMTRDQLELGVSRILQANNYAQPMNIAKMLIGQYENRYGAIFNISEPVNATSGGSLNSISFESI